MKKKALADLSLPLREGSTNLVFGVGHPEAKVLFIGEGPGFWEDKKGVPFVGNAGALLDQLLLLIKLPRENVYITNVIMYRAPENRDPTEEEIHAFAPYLDGIIEIIEPKLIVTLGRFSMAKFLPGVFISNVHGKVREVDWKGEKILILPMYHPAAALRNGEVKEKLKADFQIIPEVLLGKEKEKSDTMKEGLQIKLI